MKFVTQDNICLNSSFLHSLALIFPPCSVCVLPSCSVMDQVLLIQRSVLKLRVSHVGLATEAFLHSSAGRSAFLLLASPFDGNLKTVFSSVDPDTLWIRLLWLFLTKLSNLTCHLMIKFLFEGWIRLSHKKLVHISHLATHTHTLTLWVGFKGLSVIPPANDTLSCESWPPAALKPPLGPPAPPPFILSP